ncbi:MAG: hypothetical protein IKM66_07440 [Clostridia bacterium]|nr:hypothetical protein [Clostridia bacterium]
MKKLYLDTKEKIYRATSIMFIVQLFGALGAGFFFVIQNIFQTYHILGATGATNEPTLWFILFWATDFFFVALAVVLSYLIAGLPGIAPSLALAVYFCHFTAPSESAEMMYNCFFATPANYSEATSIGYMGYLIMTVMLSLLIKLLFAGWSEAKKPIGRGFDSLLAKLRKKIKLIPDTLKGIDIIDGVDLIVLVLIIPVACCALTFIAIKYGIEIPFAALSDSLKNVLTDLANSNVIVAALVMGLMVGFDLIGPVSLAAFSVATTAYLTTGNAQLITIYSVCFITVGWTAFFGILCCKLFKKGGKPDTDDFNLATTGPINAFFENIKLTVAPSMPLAMRSPFTMIPGFMAGSAFGGVVTALFGIVNTAYTDGSFPRYGTGNFTYGAVDYTYAELFEKGEIYMSFTLPLRSGDFLTCRLPLFFIILISAFVGGLVIMALREGEYRFLSKRGCYFEPKSDLVIEIREHGKKLAAALKGKKADEAAEENKETIGG